MKVGCKRGWPTLAAHVLVDGENFFGGIEDRRRNPWGELARQMSRFVFGTYYVINKPVVFVPTRWRQSTQAGLCGLYNFVRVRCDKQQAIDLAIQSEIIELSPTRKDGRGGSAIASSVRWRSGVSARHSRISTLLGRCYGGSSQAGYAYGLS